MQVDHSLLEAFLVDTRLLGREEAASLRERAVASGVSFYEVVTASGRVDEDELRRAASHVLGVSFVSLSPADIDTNAMLLVPEPLARTHMVIPFARRDDTLEVAMLDLSAFPLVQKLLASRGLRLVPRLTNRASLRCALLVYQDYLKREFGEKIRADAQAIVGLAGVSEVDYAYVAGRLPVARLVESLLQHALQAGASNVYIEPRGASALVRYRIGGVLFDAMTLPGVVLQSIALRFRQLAGLPLLTKGPHEGRFVFDTNNDSVSVWVATLPADAGERIALRLMRRDSGGEGFSLETLGLHGEGLEAVHRALSHGRGLVVVSGGAGSGRSTTLYTILDTLLLPSRSVMTIETATSCRVPVATQISLGSGLTLSAAMRAGLMQDPNILLVDPVSDAQEASLVAHAAAREVLVLAGAAQEDLFEQHNPLLTLGVKVLPRLCASCRKIRRLTRAEIDMLERHADFARVLAALKSEGLMSPSVAWKDIEFYRQGECASCSASGSGKVGIQSVASREQGVVWRSVEDALYKAALGLLSVDEVLGVAESEGDIV